MLLPTIATPSFELPRFDGTNFTSWKNAMSSYLRAMNSQIWWIVDIGFSHDFGDHPPTKAQEKCLYLEAHAFNVLFSALSVEVEDIILKKYGHLENAHLIWQALEKMYDSSNDEKSFLENDPENISPSTSSNDQHQDKPSRDQENRFRPKEESTSPTSSWLEDEDTFSLMIKRQRESKRSILEKGDDLSNIDACATNSLSLVQQLEKANQMIFKEYQRLAKSHTDLQERYSMLLNSHEKLVDTYVMLETTHEVALTMVKCFQPHTCRCAPISIDLSCANVCCSQEKPSYDEHETVENCDDFITSENDAPKGEVEHLKTSSMRSKARSHVQQSQDNRVHMVKKLEKGSITTCIKAFKTNMRKKLDMSNKEKDESKGDVMYLECPNKKEAQPTLSSRRRCFGCKEKGHKVIECPTQIRVKNVCENRTVRFDKPDSPTHTNKSKSVEQLLNGFVSSYNKYMNNIEGTRRKPKKKAKKVKYQICYICREKGHISEECPMKQNLTSNKSHIASTSCEANSNTNASMMIGSSSGTTKLTWMPKSSKVNLLGPNKVWVPKCV